MARVVAVITAYRPQRQLLLTVESALAQTESCIVIDDGTGEDGSGAFLMAKGAGAVVIRERDNRGIAAAANRGIARARHLGAEFVLLLDQDSQLPEDFVSVLLATYERSEALGHHPAFVVPESFGRGRHTHRQANLRIADGTLFARKVIQSGMLVPIHIFDELGGLDEAYFIDLVDAEFEMRCEASGRTVVAAPGTTLVHSLGTLRVRRSSGRSRASRRPIPHTVSQPFRYYYQLRNRRILNRTFWRRFPRRIARDSILDAAHFMKVALDADSFRSIMTLYWHGWRDGRLSGLRGRMPDSLRVFADSIGWRSEEVTEADASQTSR